MNKAFKHVAIILAVPCLACLAEAGFEGRIEAKLTLGSHAESYSYSVGANMLRVARTETDHPHAMNLVELDTGAITLVFSHNRSYMRFNPRDKKTAAPAGFPGMPMPPGGLPAGIGPQGDFPGSPEAPASLTPPAHIGPAGLPGMPAVPAEIDGGMPMPPGTGSQPNPIPPSGVSAAPVIPAQPGPMNISGISDMQNMPGMPADLGEGMPMPEMVPGPGGRPEQGLPGEPARPTPRRSSRKLQFSATDQTTNMLGYACTLYELRQRDQVMEIWATDQLLPFQPWLQDPPLRHHGPQDMEECWGEMLRARELFPLRVELKNADGKPLPFEFKVTSITPKHFGKEGAKLFEPPADYQKLDPPPF